MFTNSLSRNQGAELPTLFSAPCHMSVKSKRNWDRLISPTLAVPLRAARSFVTKFIPTPRYHHGPPLKPFTSRCKLRVAQYAPGAPRVTCGKPLSAVGCELPQQPSCCNWSNNLQSGGFKKLYKVLRNATRRIARSEPDARISYRGNSTTHGLDTQHVPTFGTD
jgi:hypothetical protein